MKCRGDKYPQYVFQDLAGPESPIDIETIKALFKIE